MNKTFLYLFGILVVALFLGYFTLSSAFDSSANSNLNSAVNAQSAVSSSANVQNIVLSFKNGNYYPNTITVKAGVPVRISLDSSVRGCYRDFNIKSLGLRKLFSYLTDTLEFTPAVSGKYAFTCSMNMGKGILIVE